MTLKHAFGSTTIPEEPERIVTVGYNEDDFVLALGVKPVGVRDFIGTFDEDDRVWPRELHAGTKPEKVGARRARAREGRGATKSRPDGGRSKATAADTWQDQTLITGRALGREKQAQAVVYRVEGRFAKAREEHPEFEGKTLAYALLGEGGANTYSPRRPIYGPSCSRRSASR